MSSRKESCNRAPPTGVCRLPTTEQCAIFPPLSSQAARTVPLLLQKAFQLALRAGLLTAVYGGLLLTQPDVGPTVQTALLIVLKLLGRAA